MVALAGVQLPAFAQRSAFGMARVYNLLPQEAKDAKTVSTFQAQLQQLLKARAEAGCDDWADTFTTRRDFMQHPLIR